MSDDISSRPSGNPIWDEPASVASERARARVEMSGSTSNQSASPSSGSVRSAFAAVMGIPASHLDRETVARAVDPPAWLSADGFMKYGAGAPGWSRNTQLRRQSSSLAKADAVLQCLSAPPPSEVRVTVLQEVLDELARAEVVLKDVVDFNRHRDDIVGRINGLRTAAQLVRERIAAETGTDGS